MITKAYKKAAVQTGGNMKLRASAIVEVIVASTMFLIVFMLSLTTVSRIVIHGGNDEWVMIEADHRTETCFSRYAAGEHSPGTYTDEFEWGKVTTEISPYGKYDDLFLIVITADINNDRRKIRYSHVVEAWEY